MVTLPLGGGNGGGGGGGPFCDLWNFRLVGWWPHCKLQKS